MNLKFKKAQNLIEFVVILPLLVVILFGIVEIAVFWRAANAVQQIALSVAESAASAYVNPDEVNPVQCIGAEVTASSTTNNAVCKGLEVMQKKMPALGYEGIKFSKVDLGTTYGTEPYTIYEYQNQAKDNLKAGDIKLTIDYRDPYANGVVVQAYYNYTTILLGCSFTLPGGSEVTIIPKNIEITSSKIQQYNQY